MFIHLELSIALPVQSIQISVYSNILQVHVQREGIPEVVTTVLAANVDQEASRTLQDRLRASYVNKTLTSPSQDLTRVFNVLMVLTLWTKVKDCI